MADRIGHRAVPESGRLFFLPPGIAFTLRRGPVGWLHPAGEIGKHMESVKMPTGKWEIVRIGKMGDAIRRIRLPHPPYDSEAEANEAAREEKEKDPDAEYITVEVSEDIVPGK